MVIRALGALLAGYITLLLLVRLMEPRLIFFPGTARRLTPPPPELGLSPQSVRFRT